MKHKWRLLDAVTAAAMLLVAANTNANAPNAAENTAQVATAQVTGNSIDIPVAGVNTTMVNPEIMEGGCCFGSAELVTVSVNTVARAYSAANINPKDGINKNDPGVATTITEAYDAILPTANVNGQNPGTTANPMWTELAGGARMGAELATANNIGSSASFG